MRLVLIVLECDTLTATRICNVRTLYVINLGLSRAPAFDHHIALLLRVLVFPYSHVHQTASPISWQLALRRDIRAEYPDRKQSNFSKKRTCDKDWRISC